MSEEKHILKGEKQYDLDVLAKLTASKNPFLGYAVEHVRVVDGDTGAIITPQDETLKHLATSLSQGKNYLELMQQEAKQVLNKFPGGPEAISAFIEKYPHYADSTVGPYIHEAQHRLQGTELVSAHINVLETKISERAKAAVSSAQVKLGDVLHGLGDIGNGLDAVARPAHSPGKSWEI